MLKEDCEKLVVLLHWRINNMPREFDKLFPLADVERELNFVIENGFIETSIDQDFYQIFIKAHQKFMAKATNTEKEYPYYYGMVYLALSLQRILSGKKAKEGSDIDEILARIGGRLEE